MYQLDTSSVPNMLLGLNILHVGQNFSCWTHRGNSQLFIYRFRQWSTKILGKWREKRSGNIIVV